MVEFVLMTETREATGDPAFDCKAWQRGDVVDIGPDGLDWGDRVFGGNPGSHSFFRVIKMPHVSFSAAKMLVAEEKPTEQTTVFKPMLHKRMYGFDFEHPEHSPAFRSYLADDARTERDFTLSDYTDKNFMSLFKKKQPVSDGIIG